MYIHCFHLRSPRDCNLSTFFLNLRLTPPQCLDIYNFLDGLGSKDKWTFLIYTNTVFNPDAYTPSPLGPAVIVWDVDAGLDRYTHVFFKGPATGKTGAVVHV